MEPSRTTISTSHDLHAEVFVGLVEVDCSQTDFSASFCSFCVEHFGGVVKFAYTYCFPTTVFFPRIVVELPLNGLTIFADLLHFVFC